VTRRTVLCFAAADIVLATFVLAITLGLLLMLANCVDEVWNASLTSGLLLRLNTRPSARQYGAKGDPDLRASIFSAAEAGRVFNSAAVPFCEDPTGMKKAMTTRRWLVVITFLALAMWIARGLSRTLPLRPHLIPSPIIPGAFEYSDCPYRRFWPKFWRTLLGQPWPGDFVCPYHPNSQYIEPPINESPRQWLWDTGEAS